MSTDLMAAFEGFVPGRISGIKDNEESSDFTNLYSDCFKEEDGFFKCSNGNYLYFIEKKVFLVKVQDLTIP